MASSISSGAAMKICCNIGVFTAVHVALLLAGIRPSTGFYIQPEPISFTVDPETQLACEGCSVEFICEIQTQATAANLPAPELGWTVNGTAISEAFDQSEFTVTSQSDSRSTLRITAALKEHTGSYRCVATDGDDSSKCRTHRCIPTVTLSREAKLTVLGSAADSESVVLASCSTVLLTCGVGGHQLEATWSRDGMELLGEPGPTLLPSGSLLIVSNSNTSNATGLYQCMVAFPGGQIVTVASYDIWHSEEMNLLNPEFEVVASSPLALESHPFELICITHNFYPDKISWIRDSVPIDVGSGMGLTLSGSALIFDSLEVGASGNYCCQLPNGGVGQVLERCAQLSVVGKPVLSSIQNGTTILLNNSTENSAISLGCGLITDDPFLIVSWFWNGELLDEESSGNDIQLITSGGAELFGIYQCFASNPAGSTSILVRVLPLGLSNPPSMASVEEIPIPNIFTNPFRVTLRFTWQPPYYTGGLNGLFYRISYIAKRGVTERLCTNLTEAVGYTEDLLTTDVRVVVVSSVLENMCLEFLSEETISSDSIDSLCINEVLFPPELTVNCNGSTFTTSWQNNRLNKDIYNKDTENYTLSRTCTYGNETQRTTTFKLVNSMDDIQDLAAGTTCTSTAAALPPLGDREGHKKQCYDLTAVQFSEEVGCTIIANVSIEFSEYTVMESSGQATVCVVANGFGFVVHLQVTFNGTADFSEVLMFDNRENNRTCIPITFKDDEIIKTPTATFSVALTSSDPNMVITRGISVVSIVDDDFAVIGFEEDTYMVGEGAGKVTVCAAIEERSSELGRDVIVELTVENGTALDGEDFISTVQMLTFNATTRRLCVEVQIVDDKILESGAESLSIILTSTDPAVNLSLGNTTVKIEDNDRPVSDESSVGVIIAVTISLVAIVALLIVLVVISYNTPWKKQQETSGYICDYIKAPFELKNIVDPSQPPFLGWDSEDLEVPFYALQKNDKSETARTTTTQEVREHSEFDSKRSPQRSAVRVQEEPASMDDVNPENCFRTTSDNSHSGMSVLSEYVQEYGYVGMSGCASPECSATTLTFDGDVIVKDKIGATHSLDSDINMKSYRQSEGMNDVQSGVVQLPAMHSLESMNTERSGEKQFSCASVASSSISDGRECQTQKYEGTIL